MSVFGFGAPALRHKAVDFLDPALGVLAVAAHVPLAHRTIGAGNRIRTADDPDHQVALFEGTAWTRIDDAAEGFMPQHQAGFSGRRPAVFPFDDLDVGPADADSHGFDQDRALTHVRLREIFVPR